MNRKTVSFFSALLTGMLLQGVPQAQDSKDKEYRVKLDFGYRWNAFFRGSRDLYRTQLDLGEGPKLFSGDVFFSPAAGSDKLFDRLQLNLNGWGGEPYNTARLKMVKNEIYELDFRYQNLAYFSSIPSFANPLLERGGTTSQHREDTSLRTNTLEFRLWPGKTWSPFVAYQRTTRFGPVSTTLPADGDEFLIDQNLEFSSDDLRGGMVFQFNRFSLRVEQGARWYRDQTTWSAVSGQPGNSERPFLGRDIVLESFASNQAVKSSVIPYSTASMTYRPVESLILQGRLSYSMADLRTSFYEDLTGTFFSFPELRAFYTGSNSQTSSETKAPNLYVDLSAQWQPIEKLRIVERFRTRRSHVSGSRLLRLSLFEVDPLLSNRFIDQLDSETRLEAFFGLDYDRQQLEGQFFLTPDLMLRVGHRYERRRLELDPESASSTGTESPPAGPSTRFESDRNVLILGGSYRISRRSRVSVDYELGRADEPIFRTDPVDLDRLKIDGRLALSDRLEVGGHVTLFDHEDDVVDFDSRSRGFGLQFDYQPSDRLSFSGQWERTQLDTEIPYLIPQSFQLDLFSFREFSNYGSLSISLRTVRDSELSLGYSVWGNSGDFPLNYHQPFARLEIPLGERLQAYGQWNYYGYNEKIRLFPQDYRTHLAVLGFRVRMGN